MNIPTNQGELINRVIELENKVAELSNYQSLANSLLDENKYLRKALESAKGDTKNLQKFLKGIGQTKVYNDCFNRQAI